MSATGVFPKQLVLKYIDTTFPVYRIPMLQVAAFFITFQNTLTFKIPSYAVADSVYELG